LFTKKENNPNASPVKNQKMGIKITFSANCHIPEKECTCKRCMSTRGKKSNEFTEFKAMIYASVSKVINDEWMWTNFHKLPFNKDMGVALINRLIQDLRIDQSISINSVFKSKEDGTDIPT
jgi:hypothetical protein